MHFPRLSSRRWTLSLIVSSLSFWRLFSYWHLLLEENSTIEISRNFDFDLEFSKFFFRHNHEYQLLFQKFNRLFHVSIRNYFQPWTVARMKKPGSITSSWPRVFLGKHRLPGHTAFVYWSVNWNRAGRRGPPLQGSLDISIEIHALLTAKLVKISTKYWWICKSSIFISLMCRIIYRC